MKDLKGEVQNWLSKSGYPLEMLIAQSLKKSGFGVVQSEYYEDPETGKWRETDVIAYEQFFGKTCHAIFSLVVECKNSDKPWVLFTATDNYPEALSVSRRASTEAGQSVLNTLSLKKEIRQSPLFSLPARPGYGLTIAFRDQNNTNFAYEALQSACKAAQDIVKRHSNMMPDKILPFAWPVVVVGAPLFESYLDSNGVLITEPIQKGLLIWRNPLLNRHTIVEIYTQERFQLETDTYRTSVLAFLQAVCSEHDRSPRLKSDSNPPK